MSLFKTDSVAGPSNRWFTIIMAAFTVGLLFNIGIVTYTLVESQHNDIQICEGQNEIRATIRGQISAQARILPTIKYYRDNPDELTAALKENVRSIHRFDAIPCQDPPFRDLPIFGFG